MPSARSTRRVVKGMEASVVVVRSGSAEKLT